MGWRFELLEFETGVFDAPVGRLMLEPNGGEDVSSLAQIWRDQGVWLVSARLPEEAAAKALGTENFRKIETLVTLACPILEDAVMPEGVRLATAADVEPCLDIARTAFVYDRFHADDRVPKAKADHLKEVWVQNSLGGRADAVLVVEHAGEVAGFVTCMVSDKAAVIDLIAISSRHQGQGLGPLLVQGVKAHYAGQRAAIHVGTQKSNVNSLSLYAKQGFQEMTSQVTYHWVNEGVHP